MTLSNGLTPKQNQVAILTAKQIIETGETNMTKVGLQVYDAQTPEAARTSVARTLKKDTVKEAIEDILAREGITTSSVAGNFRVLTHKEPEKVSAEVFLKANIELAKLLNLYPDKKSTHVSLNITGKFKGMDYNKAKEEYQRIQGETNELITEAE